MALVSVQVQRDHLQRLSRVRRPLIAIAELVWNGLDADATNVHVTITRGLTGGIHEITIADDGTGISHGDALDAFKKLGGSWKRETRRSKRVKRLLHGRGGKGRFRAFALGNMVTWHTVGNNLGKRVTFQVTGNTETLGTFDISDPIDTTEGTGTRVVIQEIPANLTGMASLLAPEAVLGMAEELRST